jgi:hypothetical protein
MAAADDDDNKQGKKERKKQTNKQKRKKNILPLKTNFTTKFFEDQHSNITNINQPPKQHLRE